MVLRFLEKTFQVLQVVLQLFEKTSQIVFTYLGTGFASLVSGIASVRCLGRFIMSKNALIENALTLGHN